uniref:Choline transporter-like protein n=1 Tax=Gouania willdenowi TaxID=441366 RepID=A0A8C5I0Q7_GOUWI
MFNKYGAFFIHYNETQRMLLFCAGEPRQYDPNFKGPIHDRGCTDIVCCILFVIALLGYFAVGVLSWSQGDPRKVIYPTDSRGQFCGHKGTPLEGKPMLFYFNIMKCASPLVLLEFQCPTTQVFKIHLSTLFSKPVFMYQTCNRDVCTACESLLNKYCGMVSVLQRINPLTTQRCFPALGLSGGVITVGNNSQFDEGDGKIREAKDLLDGVKNATVVIKARHVVMKVFEDYTQSWYWILLGLFIAMVLSLVFIVLLRFLAVVMVWVMIILVIAVIGYGIFHCYMEYDSLATVPGADVTLEELGFQTDFTVYLEVRQTWLAFMIILAVVEVIIIFLLIFLRKRILIAIALIKEASRAIGHIMCSLLYPLFTFVLLAVVICYFVVVAVFLSTSNVAVYKVFNDTECEHSRKTCEPAAECSDSECLFAFYGGEDWYHKYLIALQFYNVFLFFWCANFVIALGQMTLAGAFASYYWAFVKPRDVPTFPIFASLGRALRYHAGTLAFGSLILSIIQIIRVLLEYLDHKLKGVENKFAKFFMTCLKCCFWCLEKCVKFLNRNAYIMTAIYGKNFCTAAKDAFFLLLRNVVRVAVLDKVTDFLLFLGKLLIVGLLGVLAFFFFSGRVEAFVKAAPTLNYYWVPVVTLVIGAYLIAHGFFSVYSMCVDTLFLCFLEDLERNDGSEERPYLMPESLCKILDKKKKTPEAQ